MIAPLLLAATLAADAPTFAGSWKTNFGAVDLKDDDGAVAGGFGPGGRFKIEGKREGRTLKASYKEDSAEGDLTFEMDPSGHAFTGRFALKNGRSGSWNGWRPDPSAAEGPPANFAGPWLTDRGLMDLKQDGAKVSGKYAARGGSTIEGDVKGRHLEFRHRAFRPGVGWFDQSEDGKALAGASGPDGPGGWYGWKGRPAPEYARHAPLVPGKRVDGSTDSLLTYAARAPEGWKEGESRPAILILHGSNMNSRAYVDTIAAAWPDLANDYLVIGIDGETPSRVEGEPAFNYSYVNFVGRSTFGGFPGTDRESPALVSEAMKELKAAYNIKHFFVGGHSQGGFLTYSLLMNYPELIAGAFPISCGVIFQCEPSAYADGAIMKAQRSVPLAIVHGRNDPVVGFGMGDHAHGLFLDASWPALRLFADEKAGHMFARLPVGSAIRWLESMNADDPKRLLDFAESRMKEGGWRDVAAAVRRAKALKLDGAEADRLGRVAAAIDAEAAPDAKLYLEKIRANTDNSWVVGFLAFRDRFEFAEGAAEVTSAFAELRAKHAEPARKLMGEAMAAFQQGRRDEGYAKYREVAEKFYAAPGYAGVRKALDERK